MYTSTKIAENIKFLAKNNNVSLKKLFEECNIGRNAISHMTNGSMPKVDNIAKIADYLDVSIDYILGRTDNPNINK